MTTLVTGAGGFVGSVLVDRLLEQGRPVAALDTSPLRRPPHPKLRAVCGDLADPAVRAEALAGGVNTIIHLATVPGGAAEADPAASKRTNIDAMHDLLVDAARGRTVAPRVVYASSIAVFGDPLPPGGVDDETPLHPRLVYGGHKAMMELETAMMSRRGEIDGVTVRLAGILARPGGASGMRSAFMSDVFHALRARRAFTAPVSPSATLWVQSVRRCVSNLLHATVVDSGSLPPSRAVTLPAVRLTMAELAAEIGRQTGASMDLIDYAPDWALEQAFGAHPPLTTAAAERAGFMSDGSPQALVKAALEQIAKGEV